MTVLFIVVDLVNLGTISSVFERNGFSGGDVVMDVAGLTSVLTDIYALSRKDLTFKGTSQDMAQLVLNWLLNLYDVYEPL